MQDTVCVSISDSRLPNYCRPKQIFVLIIWCVTSMVTFLIPCGSCQVHVTSVTLVRGGTFCVYCPSGVALRLRP